MQARAGRRLLGVTQIQGAKHCEDGLALTWGCCETRNRTQVAVWPLVSKPAMKMAPTSGSSRSSASGLPAGNIPGFRFKGAIRPRTLWAAGGRAVEITEACQEDHDEVWSRRCRPAASQGGRFHAAQAWSLLTAGAG